MALTKLEEFAVKEAKERGMRCNVDEPQEQEFGNSIIHAELSMRGKVKYCWLEVYESFFSVEVFEGNPDNGPRTTFSRNFGSVDPQENISSALSDVCAELTS